MDWERIAKAWTHIAAKVTSPRRFLHDAKSGQAGATRLWSSQGDVYNEPGITPYRPENRAARDHFSQHLSC